jgi:hypothetical protein
MDGLVVGAGYSSTDHLRMITNFPGAMKELSNLARRQWGNLQRLHLGGEGAPHAAD